LFLIDAKVVPGGVTGLSIIIYYLTNNYIPVGLLMWVFNIPLYLWGLKELGKSFALRTFFAFSLNSLFLDLIRGDIPGLRFINLQNMQSIKSLQHTDFIFSILIGAVLLGVGLGIIFKFKGTTAGSDIVAAILHKHYGIKTGHAIILTDFVIICLAGFVLEIKGLAFAKSALVLTLYAIFALIVSGRILDMILDGLDYVRVAYIISDKHELIADSIMNDLNRGATALKTRGLYRDVEREVIMTVVAVKEVGTLVDKIRGIDPEAFVIINNVHEVLGKGFSRRF